MSLLSNEETRLGLSASGLISRELSVRSLDTSAQVRSVDTSDKKSVEAVTSLHCAMLQMESGEGGEVY